MSLISDETRKWWILSAMSVTAGLILLDETVVGVALPVLREDLSMSATASHWVVSIYLLVFGCCAAAGGRLGDILGFRRLTLAGLFLFGVGSLFCGLAEGGATLLAARGVQGLGAAIIFPMSLASLNVAFPSEQRGMAIGLLAAFGTIFLALGPLVGGVISEFVSWRWIFWINLPMVLATSVIVILAFPPDSADERKSEPLDLPGLVTLIAGLSCLVFGIMQGPVTGWGHPAIWGAFVGAAVLLGLFVRVESRKKMPLIDVELFRNQAFTAANMSVFIAQYSKITVVVFGALYLQDQIGMKPSVAGVALLLGVVGLPFLSGPVGKMADKTGARKLVLRGLALSTLSVFWIALFMGRDSYALLSPGLLFFGIGLSFIFAPALREMANAVPVEKQGQVGGIGVTFRLLGGTIAAALGSCLQVATGGFEAVFLVTGVFLLATFAFAYVALARDSGPPPPTGEHHHRLRFLAH